MASKQNTPAKKTEVQQTSGTTTPKKTEEKAPADIAMDLVIRSLAKEYGSNIVIDASNQVEFKKLMLKDNHISSGSLTLDNMTGIGGLPTGRVIEIFGPEGKGKTTMCLCACAVAQQKNGYFVLYVDAEHRLDLDYARALGVDVDDKTKFAVVRPDHSDHVFGVIDKLLGLGKPLAIIVDSIPAIVPSTVAEKEWGDSSAMARQALEMNEFLQKCNPKIAKTQSLFMFTNQLRSKGGGNFWYQGPAGGKAIPYYSTIRMNINWDPKKDMIVIDDLNVGAYITVTFVKTNTSAPPKPRRVCLQFGKGFWRSRELVEIAVQEGIINKASSWLSYGEGENEIKSQGKPGFCALVENDKKLFTKIEKDIKTLWRMK